MRGSSALSIQPQEEGKALPGRLGTPVRNCGDAVQVRSPNLVFTFRSSTFVFPGKYSILRQSFAPFFITLGSSLLYKPANFQSHLLTQTERHRHRQAGHKNALGNISKQWQGFLVVKKKSKKKKSLSCSSMQCPFFCFAV